MKHLMVVSCTCFARKRRSTLPSMNFWVHIKKMTMRLLEIYRKCWCVFNPTIRWKSMKHILVTKSEYCTTECVFNHLWCWDWLPHDVWDNWPCENVVKVSKIRNQRGRCRRVCDIRNWRSMFKKLCFRVHCQALLDCLLFFKANIYPPVLYNSKDNEGRYKEKM